jgi:phosphoserine phosphatase RsbU/P
LPLAPAGVILRRPSAPPVPHRSDRFDLRALLETSRLLASSLEVDFVLGSLLLSAMSKLLVTRGVVLLDDPLAAGWRVEAVKGRFPAGGLAAGEHVRFDGPREILEGEALPEPLRQRGLALLLPIAYHERMIGYVALGPKATGQPFTADERAFVDSLVHMSATAVHNAWVVEELKQANQELGQRVQQLHTLFDLAQGFNSAPDEERAARLLTLTLMGQFMVRRFVVLLCADSARGELEVAASRDAPDLEPPLMALLADLPRLLLLDEDAPDAYHELRQRGFAMALPLRMKDATRGVLLLGPKGNRQPYDADEVDFLTALGQLALTAIENARGVEARLEKERLEEELRLARSIQERLLPQELPRLACADLAALNLASQVVAGDYYDALALDEHRYLLAVADVSGKGLPASLLMANLQACLHVLAASLAAGTVDLPTATQRVNRVVHRNTGMSTFITFFWGIYDTRDGRFEYVNAGHNPPLLVRRDGTVEGLEAGGLLLGVLPEAAYEQGAARLASGDTLALFTDGITEAWSATDRDDEFGEERLIATIRDSAGRSAADVLAAVRSAVRAHTAGGPLDDDLTLMVLRCDLGG